MILRQSPGNSKPSLLIVDDDEATLEGLATALDPEFTVRSASSADEAMRLIRQDRPELLLLDQGMPGTNGLALLHLLRDDPRPVPVMLSAEADLELVRQALRLGAQDVLPKPCDIGTLVAALHAAVLAGKQCLSTERVPYALRAARLMAQAHELEPAPELLSQQTALAQSLRNAAIAELPRDYQALSKRMGL